MDLGLTERIALVTGSSKGIGEGIARGLAREGALVVIHGRDTLKSEEVAHDIIRQGGRAEVVTGDLTVDNEVTSLFGQLAALKKPVGILVNNAGGSGKSECWPDMHAAIWSAAYDRNVLAAVTMISGLLPGMQKAGWGRIINISSLAGLMPPAAKADYAAAKAAMLAMTSSLAKAVAKDGITANSVSPGTIHSAKLDSAFRQAAAGKGIPTNAPWEEIERVALPLFAEVPMGRVGTLVEIADTVLFLASPLSGYITGMNIRMDGGVWPGL